MKRAEKVKVYLAKPKSQELILVLLAIIPHFLIAFGNQNAVLEWYQSDDAFYYFKVARNITEGYGVTFDGINITNGFQPLWMLVCIPIFAFASIDTILPLRILIVVLAALNAAAGVLLFRLIKRVLKINSIALLVASAWVFGRPIHELTVKAGVEAGLSAFFIILLWDRLTAFNMRDELGEDGLRKMVTLGFIATLTILSRLDNVFLVFFAGVWLWFRWWQPPEGEYLGIREKWLWRVKTGSAYNGPIVFFMAIYLSWNYFVFESLVPISAKLKIWWGIVKWTAYGSPVKNVGEAITQLFSAKRSMGPLSVATAPLYNSARAILGFLRLGLSEHNINTVFMIQLVALGVITIALVRTKRQLAYRAIFQLGLPALLLGSIFQISYYMFVGSVALKEWYWVSETVFLSLLLGFILTLIYHWVINFRFMKFNGLDWGIVVLAGIGLISNHYIYLYKWELRGQQMEHQHYLSQVAWVEENIDKGTIIGQIGSGSAGYFWDNYTVVNLDGLINNHEYFQHLQAGTTADYILDMGVTFIVSSPFMVENAQPYANLFKDRLELTSDRSIYSEGGISAFRLLPEAESN